MGAQQPGELSVAVDEIMAAYTGESPGAVVAVVREGEVVFARGYGMANLEHGIPLTRESVLDIGSVSKQLTAFATVLLAQDGRLALDDDIRTHLPEVPDFGSTITVRHLIHHVSGLREIYTSEAIAGYRGGDGIRQEDALQLTRHMRELNFEPGSSYLYCNTGYMLLADIVARVSGMPFAEFMEERIFGPLEMSHTTIMSRPGQSIPGAAESYARLREEDGGGFVRVFDNSSIQGAGGVYTTVDDLARWMGNFATGEVGGSGAMEQMKSRGVLSGGDTLDYAFGLDIGRVRGQRMISHGGSSAGYRASFNYLPAVNGGVIVLSNLAQVDGSIPGRVGELFFADVLGTVEESEEASEAADSESPEEPEEDPWRPSAAELAELEGGYFSPELETLYTFHVEDGMLKGRHRRHGDFELTPVEPDVFQAPSFLGRVRVQRDGAGAVEGLRVDNGRVRNLRFEKLDG